MEETDLGGADDGIDLILSKDGRHTLVQRDQWKRQQVRVIVMREVNCLLAHDNANAVKTVCSNTYKKDAGRSPQGAHIELISSMHLLETISGAAANEGERTASDPLTEPNISRKLGCALGRNCPRDEAAVIKQWNLRADNSLMSCS
ncbi:restriction system protein [Xanthomonas arboricola]